SEIRQNIKKASLESNWAEVLELAEKAMGMECGRGWLDLQRYVGRACYELGYEAIKSAVIGSLRTLLADYPDLPQMTMMDDTPTANAETQSWIAENAAPAAPAADSAPVQEYTTPAYYEQPAAETPAGEPPPPDPFDLAMQAVRQGRPQEGMELLMREMGQERSGRGRFTRKVQLAKVCNSAGHDEIAFPILKELSDEIERRRLDDWEASEFVADPLALLYRCLGKSGASPEERQKLYAWICRLDPLAAMKVAR
ncbi:MAG TPA: type VI secretion system domain-containing protein, partial [Bryobacteraceae bacterium]